MLAFDTATRATAVALCDPASSTELEARDDPLRGERPRHATRLMPLVVELLERAEIGWAELNRIAVGVGPGTFTGLRIGIATARALGRARGTPVVGISTLRSLALGGECVRIEDIDTVLAVIDARRGEVFAAGWAVPGGASAPESEPLFGPIAIAPDELASMLGEQPPQRALAIGDGAVEFRAVLERAGAVVPEDDSELHRVSAINHCRLARTMRPGGPDEIRPEYLRLPDAELARRATGNR